MRRPCSTSRALDGRVNRYYDPVTGEFITIDPLYGGTSDPPQTGPGTGSSPQPVSIYQWVLGVANGTEFNRGDPAAGLNRTITSIQFNGGVSTAGLNLSTSGDTTGAVDYPNAFGLPDVALDHLSSIAGLAMTNPGPPNPTYVGAGFFDPNSVSSSDSPYGFADEDPVDEVDPTGLSGNPADVFCSDGNTRACKGALKIAKKVTSEECANDPTACSGGYTADQICAAAATSVFIPGINFFTTVAINAPCVIYELVKNFW